MLFKFGFLVGGVKVEIGERSQEVRDAFDLIPNCCRK
jgi:hypothetical protein